MTFSKILVKYRKIALSERDKSDRSEPLMQAYLQTGPKHAFLFMKVWLRHEFGELKYLKVDLESVMKSL